MSNVIKAIGVILRIAKDGPFTFKPIGESAYVACCFCGVMAAHAENLKSLTMHTTECLYREAVEAVG